MNRRPAGSAIAQHLEDIFKPNVERTRGASDPYWYGLNEQDWKSVVEHQDKLAKQKVRDGDLMGARSGLQRSLGIDNNELDLVMRNVTRGKGPKHIEVGVPHSFSGEKVMRDALLLSGRPSKFNNQGDGQATDLLTTMLNNLDTYVDVQHRTGSRDDLSIGALLNINNRGAGIDAYRRASPQDTLGSIIEEAKANSGRFNYDKLLHTKANVQNDRGLGYQKDLLIGGRYDNIVNEVAPRHGFYNPTMPSDVQVTDLNKLREELMSMSKRDFESREGARGQIIRGAQDKLKFQIPMNVVNEIASASSILDPDVIRAMEKSSRN